MQIQGVPFDELRLGLLLACSSVRVSSPFIFVKRLVPFGCREEGRQLKKIASTRSWNAER